MNHNFSVIGANIKKYRKALKMKQTELAKKINKTESSIRKYEKGEVKIPITVLDKIATILKVSYFDLTIDTNALEIETKNFDSFLNFLKSIGYNVIEYPEGKEGESYSISLIKNEVTIIFTKEEFEDFQLETKKTIDYQVWLKSQSNKK